MALTSTPPGPPSAVGGESSDAGDMPSPPTTGVGVRRRAFLGTRRRQIVAFAVIAAAVAVLLLQGLGNATVYFKTADEAVAQRAQLGSHRFRIEGTVQPGVREVGQDVAFVIANNGASVDVIQRGSPPQLFKPGIPVVLEGHFAPDGHFASDLIMVKHTATYTEQHPDRVKSAGTSIPVPPSAP